VGFAPCPSCLSRWVVAIEATSRRRHCSDRCIWASGMEEQIKDIEVTKKEAPIAAFNSSELHNSHGFSGKPSKEDEVMEAMRLLLIENNRVVAQEHLSAGVDAANDDYIIIMPTNNINIDAGDIDPRLAGCGPLTPGVAQALTLWKDEMVTNGELLELVVKAICGGHITPGIVQALTLWKNEMVTNNELLELVVNDLAFCCQSVRLEAAEPKKEKPKCRFAGLKRSLLF
jgi:hypothetical protein